MPLKKRVIEGDDVLIVLMKALGIVAWLEFLQSKPVSCRGFAMTILVAMQQRPARYPNTNPTYLIQ
ncbi:MULTISPECIES: hypothetical protein [unclassified Rickettsia]|uniref:hypothetical protein n=1 Tax=unclassified Rickettsia TaxID=114295 RepID=UPI0031331474